MMLTFIMLLLYVAGAIATARHLTYQVKLRNDGRQWHGAVLRPRLYKSEDYRREFAEAQQARHRNGELFDRRNPLDLEYPDDYREVFQWSLFFPLYWVGYVVKDMMKSLVFGGVSQTPTEIREAQELEEKRRAAEKLRVQRLYEETERLRKEQDGL